MMKVLGKMFCIFLLSLNSYAGMLVEPSLGYRYLTGEADQSYNGRVIDTVSYDYNAAVLGGRLGYQKLGFALGLDLSFSPPSDLKEEYKNNKAVTYRDYSQFSQAFFIHYRFSQFFIPFNLRGSYILNTSLDGDSTKGSSVEGSGYSVGLELPGFLPLVNLNLEYRRVTYDKSPLGDKADWKTNEFTVALSCPLEFFK